MYRSVFRGDHLWLANLWGGWEEGPGSWRTLMFFLFRQSLVDCSSFSRNGALWDFPYLCWMGTGVVVMLVFLTNMLLGFYGYHFLGIEKTLFHSKCPCSWLFSLPPLSCPLSLGYKLHCRCNNWVWAFHGQFFSAFWLALAFYKSLCLHKKKLFWWIMRETLIFVYKDKFIE